MTQNELKLAIYESTRNNELSQEVGYKMIGVFDSEENITEGVLSNPLRKSLNKLKEIREAKPKSYSGPEDVKKFVDDHYDEIIKISKIAEKEPKDIRDSEIKTTIGYIVSVLSGIGIMTLGAAKNSFILGGAGIIPGILGTLFVSIYPLIKAIRINNDIKASDELVKVRDALNKLDTKNLPEEYKNKITDIINAINDADTEISARFNAVAKESVIDMKLKIHEAFEFGNITESERDTLLDRLG